MDALLIVLVIQASAIDDDMESRICGRTLAVSMSRRRSQIHGVLRRISPCLRARHVRRVNPAPCFRGCPCTRRCSPIGVRCCGSGCTIKTGRICTTTCTAP